ncbi:hypothetical protein H8E77_40480, partial [bacterium]|nr:hypothetical protein [bacterium]
MKVKFAFRMLILALMLGFLAVNNSFAEIKFTQLSVYDPNTTPDGHYTTSGEFPGGFDDASEASAESKPDQLTIGALKKGAPNVPLLKVEVTGEAGDLTYLETLTVVYTGQRQLDIGNQAIIYKANYHDNDDLKSTSFINEGSIASGSITFRIPASTILAGTTVNYIIALDISSSAGSNNVDLRVKSVNGFPTTGFIPAGNIVNDPGNI